MAWRTPDSHIPVSPPLGVPLTCISYLDHGLRVAGTIWAMSYSIIVTARSGQLTVEHSGNVPDGKHVISGHEDTSYRSVGVIRHDPEGRQLATSSAGHHKEH